MSNVFDDLNLFACCGSMDQTDEDDVATTLPENEKENSALIAKREARKQRIEAAQNRRNAFIEGSEQRNSLLDDSNNKGLSQLNSFFDQIGKSFQDCFMEEVIVESDTNDTHATMNKTNDALMERGEKLENVANKCEDLVNSAEDYSNMAAKLVDSQKKGIFGRSRK